MRILEKSLSYWWVIMLAAALLGMAGCANWQGSLQGTSGAEKSNPYDLTWQEGLRLFESGNYDQALAAFEKLSHMANDPALRRKALYGLSCTLLATAGDDALFEDAVAHWRLWRQLRSAVLGPEDPLMLDPFIERIGNKKVELKSTAGKARMAHDKHYEKLLQEKDEKIKALQHQLQELEKIHLKIQQKKSEVSSP